MNIEISVRTGRIREIFVALKSMGNIMSTEKRLTKHWGGEPKNKKSLHVKFSETGQTLRK